jgi:hypothetical protein
MTPERLTGLAALLLDTRDWLAEYAPGSLDYWLIDALIDRLAEYRRRLVAEGAR